MEFTIEDVNEIIRLTDVDARIRWRGWGILWTGWKEDLDPRCIYENRPKELRSDNLLAQWAAVPLDSATGKPEKNYRCYYASSGGRCGRLSNGELIDITLAEGWVAVTSSDPDVESLKRRTRYAALIELLAFLPEQKQ